MSAMEKIVVEPILTTIGFSRWSRVLKSWKEENSLWIWELEKKVKEQNK